MVPRQWRGRSRHLALLLSAVIVPPAATLVWLGVTILHQDRDLAVRHAEERRTSALQSVVLSLEQSLSEAARYLDADAVPDRMVKVVMSGGQVTATPSTRLWWLPASAAAVAPADDRFADADRAAFSGREAEALAAYRDGLQSSDSGVKALALVSIARVHRLERRWDQALAAYRTLAGIRDAIVAGAPADLQGRRQICDVLAAAGRKAELDREVEVLRRDLLNGRWQVDGPAWARTVADIEQWSGKAVEVDAERRRFSLAAGALQGLGAPATEGVLTHTLVVDGVAVTTITRRTVGGVVGLLAGRAQLAEWMEVATRGLEGAADLSIVGKQGELLAGHVAGATGRFSTRRAEESGLPWTVRLTWTGASDAAGPAGVAGERASRLPLFIVGFGAILALAGGGGYLLWRVVQRELVVTRLQSEFVSAVSHEFRTPLTSLRHATELLHEHDDLTPERRRTFYEAMESDTRRLQRLVESLLDFSRMESGRKAYDLKPLRISDFVADVVQEFRASRRGHAESVEIHSEVSVDAGIRADAASLANAVWNLLDNAVKYSPPGARVMVVVRQSAGEVSIAVADRGIGIPASEQKDVFGRFVRGAAAVANGIPGTGLGLALVSHIVEAHAGTVRLESEPGRGSTFTIALPGAIASTGSGS